MTLEDMANSFYKELYLVDSSVQYYPDTWNFLALDQNDLRWLNRLVSEGEVKNALF